MSRLCLTRLLFLTLGFLLTTSVARHALAQAAGEGTARGTYDFNSGWRLLVGDPKDAGAIDFDDSTWQPVTLPRAWNEDDAFRVGIRDLRTGVAWYRKRFALPESDRGKNVYLE